jgi:PhnB protein
MTIKALSPYLILDGTAQQAIDLYIKALGARIDGQVMRYGDMAGNQQPDATKNYVMHAKLNLAGTSMMLSDAPPGKGHARGEQVQICLEFSDVADEARAFDALAQGGQITNPLQDMFWGARWGTVVDRFGIAWMFNCETKK